MTKDIIIEIKTSLKECSKEAKALFKKGGYSAEEFAQFEADGTMPKTENLLGYVCTPPMTDVKTKKTYCTVRIDAPFAEAIAAIGQTINARHIKVIGEVDNDEPFLIEVQSYGIDGQPKGTKMQEIGKIA